MGGGDEGVQVWPPAASSLRPIDHLRRTVFRSIGPNDIDITEQKTLAFRSFIGRLRSTLKSEWPLPGTIRIHHEPYSVREANFVPTPRQGWRCPT
jgi:hypothetical protein